VFDRRSLVGRQDLRRDLVDAETSGDRVGDQLAVAGDHRHLDAHGVELLDCLGRLLSDLILDGESAEDPAIRNNVQDGAPIATPRLRRRVRFEAHICEQAWSTDSHGSTIHGRACAPTAKRLKVGRR
jgi:hypothetical protein